MRTTVAEFGVAAIAASTAFTVLGLWAKGFWWLLQTIGGQFA